MAMIVKIVLPDGESLIVSHGPLLPVPRKGEVIDQPQLSGYYTVRNVVWSFTNEDTQVVCEVTPSGRNSP